jgi:MtN3 and saliva related transmembrane protein
MTEAIGFVAGLLTTAGMVPQIYLIYKLRSAREISMEFVITFLLGIALWLVYGTLLHLWSVVFWNTLNLVLCVILLHAKLKWGNI